MYKLIGVMALLLLSSGVNYAQSSTPNPQEPSARSDVSSLPVYSDSPAGLESLFSDALKASVEGRSTAVLAYGQSLVLPDAEAWFVSKFGDVKCKEKTLAANDCLGPRLAAAYGTYSPVLPASFEMTLGDLAQEGLTNFEVVDYTGPCASPQRIVPSVKLVGSLTTTPVLSSMLSGLVQRHEPVYVVWAYSQDKETTLAFFVYDEGAFRYTGMPHPFLPETYIQVRDSGASISGPAATPHYLTDDQLPMQNVIVDPVIVANTVVLNVVVDKEGKPKEISYVRGSEQLKEEAIRSVRKRRFDPPGFGPRGMHPNEFCLNWTPAK
jgi:hypothetical protein